MSGPKGLQAKDVTGPGFTDVQGDETTPRQRIPRYYYLLQLLLNSTSMHYLQSNSYNCFHDIYYSLHRPGYLPYDSKPSYNSIKLYVIDLFTLLSTCDAFNR